MGDISDLVQHSMVKPARVIERICDPLQIALEIPIFGFCRIEQNGTYCNISNSPDSLEFFYDHKLYLSQPYLRDPTLFQSGYTVIPVTTNGYYQQQTCLLFGINYMLLILKRIGDHMELFFFTRKNLELIDCLQFLNYLHLLNKFAAYFKKEAEALIARELSEGYNIKGLLGELYHQTTDGLFLLRNDLKAEHLLKSIYPLSPREHQCLDLFKQGYSAQATGAILHLSQRTIEHYFESIKNKLGCCSKWELLDF